MTDYIAIIEAQDEETLCRWYCALNSFEGVEELDIIDDHPKGLKEWKARQPSRASGYMKFIKDRVGAKAVSRYWNKDRMTDEEFADFWAGNHEGDEEALKRSDKRRMDKVMEELNERTNR